MKKNLLLTLSTLVFSIFLSGCTSSSASQNAAPATETETESSSLNTQAQRETDTQVSSEESSSETTSVSSNETEYITYEDEYLSYEIPSGWEKDTKNSSSEYNVTLFSPSDSTSETPSNVTVQINSLSSNVPNDVDFADESIMQSFLGFVESSTPREMKDAKISGYESGDLYVYKITYINDVDGQSVPRIGYFPQRFPYTVSVYTADFSDNVTPSLEEVAEHIIATLKVK